MQSRPASPDDNTEGSPALAQALREAVVKAAQASANMWDAMDARETAKVRLAIAENEFNEADHAFTAALTAELAARTAADMARQALAKSLAKRKAATPSSEGPDNTAPKRQRSGQ